MNICVFASGNGTNFKVIIDSINKGYLKSKISHLISDNPECGAVKTAKANNINYCVISRKIYPDLSEAEYSEKFLQAFENNETDFIVLSGYLQYLQVEIIRKFENRIINIHPSLLPSFGGKGMYGINVHKAVIESGVKVTGITIHFVNEKYDEGKIIFQKCCNVNPDDDENILQRRVRKLEHKYYKEIIKNFEDERIVISGDKVKIEK